MLLTPLLKLLNHGWKQFLWNPRGFRSVRTVGGGSAVASATSLGGGAGKDDEQDPEDLGG